LREGIMPEVARFLGDTWQYLGGPQEIQARILDACSLAGAGQTAAAPINVLAHSFGGVITAQMAFSGNLWIDRFVTFGSQPSLFEVLVEQYAPALGPYTAGASVAVKSVINRWVNLWEPLDVLAFAQAGVFALPSGVGPTDIRVPHQHQSGLST